MPLRRLLGFALFCGGGFALAYAGGRYATGALQRQEARQAWNEAQARAVVALARGATVATPNPAELVPGAAIARLIIPRLGLDEIVLEGVHDAALNAGPGHLPGSALPGEKGNAIISAHRDRHFSRLGDVSVGDTIVTESNARERWIVVSKRVIAADAPALFRTKDATLTLTTCWPVRYLGTAPERLLVTAKLVRAQTPSFATGHSE